MLSLKPINELFTSKYFRFLITRNLTLVFRHPLFSLLAFLLEKCENATQGNIQLQTEDKDNNNDGKHAKNEIYTSSEDINVSYDLGIPKYLFLQMFKRIF